MSIIPYVDRPGRPVDPAIALLGNQREGMALDFRADRAYVRDRGAPTNFYLGDASDAITFSRPSGGGRWNNLGGYEWLADSAPRYDHNPATGAPRRLLVERASSRLSLHPTDFTQAAWAKTAVDIGATSYPTPDGSTGRTMIIKASGQSASYLHQSITYAVGLSYTATGVFWAGGWTYVAIYWPNARFGVVQTAVFNLATGNLHSTAGGVTASISPLGGDRYLCRATTVAVTSDGSSQMRLYPSANGTITSVGDGVSGIHGWGVMIEEGTTPTTTILGVGSSQVTRAADIVKIPLASFPWNSGSGVLTLNGSAVTPIVSGSDLDVSAVCAAEGITHIENLVWVPA